MGHKITFLYVPGCPNCARFVDSLKKVQETVEIKVKSINLMQVPPQQRMGINVVPAIFTMDGNKLEGTHAFKWLDQFQEAVEPDGFGAFDRLPCGDFQGVNSYYGEGRYAPASNNPIKPYVE